MTNLQARKVVSNYGDKWNAACYWTGSPNVNCYKGVVYHLKKNEYWPCVCNIGYPGYLLQEQRELEDAQTHRDCLEYP